jgi:hypothetical protein
VSTRGLRGIKLSGFAVGAHVTDIVSVLIMPLIIDHARTTNVRARMRLWGCNIV